MPTILSHSAVPLAIGLGLGSRVVTKRLLLAGVVASVLPDLDVIGFRFGVHYADAAGHRGLTHSLLFALVLGAAAVLMARQLRVARGLAFAFVFGAALSHGLLDMLTNGGLGVALFWPFCDDRLFFPVHPIQVSPFGLRVFSAAGLRVFASEALWVWVPAAAVCLGLRWRRANAP